MSDEIHNLCKTLRISWPNLLVQKGLVYVMGARKETKLPVSTAKVYWALWGGRFCLCCVCVGDGRGAKGYNEDYTDSVIAGWPIVPRLQNVRRI